MFLLLKNVRNALTESSTMLLTKTTAAQNEVALSYHSVCGLYFMAVVFAATIVFTTTGDACSDQSLIYSYTMQYIIINSRQWISKYHLV